MFLRALAKTLRGLFTVSAEEPSKPLTREETIKLLGRAHEKSMETHPDTTVFFDTTRHNGRIHLFVNDRYTNVCTDDPLYDGNFSHIEIYRNNHSYMHDVGTEKGRERFVMAAANKICETLSEKPALKPALQAGQMRPGGMG